MQTPEFKGTHLFDRLCWAKENLDGVQSDYRVVYEDSVDECAKILVPDPNWMACALQGGILPPVEVYHELAKDEAQPDFLSIPVATCYITQNLLSDDRRRGY